MRFGMSWQKTQRRGLYMIFTWNLFEYRHISTVFTVMGKNDRDKNAILRLKYNIVQFLKNVYTENIGFERSVEH